MERPFALTRQSRKCELKSLDREKLALPDLLVYFHRVAPADKLMADFQLSGAVFGNLAAIYFYIYTLMQQPAGVISDTPGARKTAIIGGTSFKMASASTPWMRFVLPSPSPWRF